MVSSTVPFKLGIVVSDQACGVAPKLVSVTLTVVPTLSVIVGPGAVKFVGVRPKL